MVFTLTDIPFNEKQIQGEPCHKWLVHAARFSRRYGTCVGTFTSVHGTEPAAVQVSRSSGR